MGKYTPTITWVELTKLEPRLLALLRRAEAVKDDKRKQSFCANAVWYSHLGFKHSLSQLVGWHAVRRDDPRLRTQEAYDMAYNRLYLALPNCRNCSCLPTPLMKGDLRQAS